MSSQWNTKCRQCCSPAWVSPWFKDRKGVIHLARDRGKKVFFKCSNSSCPTNVRKAA